MKSSSRAPVTTLTCSSNSAEETRELGRRLGSAAQPGDVYLLVGALGAGKTAFTQGIGLGMGVRDQISSPTFVLCKQYAGRLPLYHFDLYRLQNLERTITEEWAELLYGSGVCVVEWADLAERILPAEHLLIEFAIEPGTTRLITFRATGAVHEERLAQLQICC